MKTLTLCLAVGTVIWIHHQRRKLAAEHDRLAKTLGAYYAEAIKA